jgi:hypothetical protein
VLANSLSYLVAALVSLTLPVVTPEVNKPAATIGAALRDTGREALACGTARPREIVIDTEDEAPGSGDRTADGVTAAVQPISPCRSPTTSRQERADQSAKPRPYAEATTLIEAHHAARERGATVLAAIRNHATRTHRRNPLILGHRRRDTGWMSTI